MMITLLIAVSAAAAPASSSIADLKSCVAAKAEEWARLADPADVIAEGALGACEPGPESRIMLTPEEIRTMKDYGIARVLDWRARRRN